MNAPSRAPGLGPEVRVRGIGDSRKWLEGREGGGGGR